MYSNHTYNYDQSYKGDNTSDTQPDSKDVVDRL